MAIQGKDKARPVDLQKKGEEHPFSKSEEVEVRPVDRSREPMKNVRVQLPESIHKALRMHCLTEDISMQDFISGEIEKKLKRLKVI